LNVTAFPLKSTAMQKDDEGHETDVSTLVPSMLTSELQTLPLNITAFPLEPTAAQKDGDEHETEVSP
jgi:hypothetical protein